MQQNYETWHAGRIKNHRYNDNETLKKDIQNALEKNPRHPFRGQISSLSELSARTIREADYINPILLHSLYLLDSNVPLDSVGPNNKNLADNVTSLYSQLSSPAKYSLISIPMQLRGIANANPYWQRDQQLGELAEKQTELSDAKNNENSAITGALGSGTLTAAAIVTGSIVFGLGLATGPAAPIVWGVLGTIAAIGLAGLAVATYIAIKFDDKVTALEDRIEDLTSPEKQERPNLLSSQDLLSSQATDTSHITHKTRANLNALREMQASAHVQTVKLEKTETEKPESPKTNLSN